MAAAHAASAAQDWRLAAKLWEALRVDFPDETTCWLRAGEAYCAAGFTGRADEILARGARLFPEHLWIAYQYTLVAQRAQDRPEALLRAEEMRKRFPDAPISHAIRAEALRDLGELEDADAGLGPAVARFPGDEWLLVGHAQLAELRGDWLAALARWEALRAVFPDHPLSAVGRGAALTGLGRFDEAEAALAAAIAQFPDNRTAAVAHAATAARRGDWDAAVRRWQAAGAHHPGDTAIELGLAEALIARGRGDEADAALDRVAAREPDNPQVEELRALLVRGRSPEEIVARGVRRRGLEAELAARVADPEVFIEITSICNFACSYCVSPMKLRDKRHMPLDTFRRALAQVAPLTTKPIRLHIDGEPTNHPQFKEMAQMVNEHGLPVWLATNGSLLDASYLDIWMDPLISMSTLPEELAQRHNKLDFDRYIAGIADYATAWARSDARQSLYFQIIHYPQPDPEAAAAYKARKDAFLLEFCRRAGLYETCTEASAVGSDIYSLSRNGHPGSVSFLKQAVAIGGLYPEDGAMVPRERATAGFCDSPWRQLVVHSNGTLGACCVDLSGGTGFASAEEAATLPIKELWENGAQITAMRRDFLAGRVERDVCQRCIGQGEIRFAETSR